MSKQIKTILLFFLLIFSTLAAQEKEKVPYPYPQELERAEKEGDSRFFREFMNMLVSLGIIIVFLIIFTWMFKRMVSVRLEKANLSSNIKILERRSLTPKTTVYILGVFGKAIAVTESANGITVLGEFKLKEEQEQILQKQKENVD